MKNKVNLRNTFLPLLPPSQAVPSPSFPQTAPTWVTFPCVAILLAQPAPKWVPHMVPSPTREPTPAWCPLSTGASPCWEPAPAQASHRFKAFLQAPACSAVGLLQGLQMDLGITFALHGLQGHCC